MTKANKRKTLYVCLVAIVVLITALSFVLSFDFKPNNQDDDKGVISKSTASTLASGEDMTPDGRVPSSYTPPAGYTVVWNSGELFNAIKANQNIVLGQDFGIGAGFFAGDNHNPITYGAILDGAGKTVTINGDPIHTWATFEGGLIGVLTGTVKNLTIKAERVKVQYDTNGGAYMGMICGSMNNGTIENCAVEFSSTVAATMDRWGDHNANRDNREYGLGGFAGCTQGSNNIIKNCTFDLSGHLYFWGKDYRTNIAAGGSSRNYCVGGFVGSAGGKLSMTNVCVKGAGQIEIDRSEIKGGLYQYFYGYAGGLIGNSSTDVANQTVIDGAIIGLVTAPIVAHTGDGAFRGYLYGACHDNNLNVMIKSVYYTSAFRAVTGVDAYRAIGDLSHPNYSGGVTLPDLGGAAPAITGYGFGKGTNSANIWLKMSNNYNAGSNSGSYVKSVNNGNSMGGLTVTDVYETASLTNDTSVLLPKTDQNVHSQHNIDSKIAIAERGTYSTISSNIDHAKYGLTWNSSANLYEKDYNKADIFNDKPMSFKRASDGADVSLTSLHFYRNLLKESSAVSYQGMWSVTKAEDTPVQERISSVWNGGAGPTTIPQSGYIGTYTLKMNDTLDDGGRYTFTDNGSFLVVVKPITTQTIRINQRELAFKAPYSEAFFDGNDRMANVSTRYDTKLYMKDGNNFIEPDPPTGATNSIWYTDMLGVEHNITSNFVCRDAGTYKIKATGIDPNYKLPAGSVNGEAVMTIKIKQLAIAYYNDNAGSTTPATVNKIFNNQKQDYVHLTNQLGDNSIYKYTRTYTNMLPAPLTVPIASDDLIKPAGTYKIVVDLDNGLADNKEYNYIFTNGLRQTTLTINMAQKQVTDFVPLATPPVFNDAVFAYTHLQNPLIAGSAGNDIFKYSYKYTNIAGVVSTNIGDNDIKPAGVYVVTVELDNSLPNDDNEYNYFIEGNKRTTSLTIDMKQAPLTIAVDSKWQGSGATYTFTGNKVPLLGYTVNGLYSNGTARGIQTVAEKTVYDLNDGHWQSDTSGELGKKYGTFNDPNTATSAMYYRKQNNDASKTPSAMVANDFDANWTTAGRYWLQLSIIDQNYTAPVTWTPVNIDKAVATVNVADTNKMHDQLVARTGNNFDFVYLNNRNLDDCKMDVFANQLGLEGISLSGTTYSTQNANLGQISFDYSAFPNDIDTSNPSEIARPSTAKDMSFSWSVATDGAGAYAGDKIYSLTFKLRDSTNFKTNVNTHINGVSNVNNATVRLVVVTPTPERELVIAGYNIAWSATVGGALLDFIGNDYYQNNGKIVAKLTGDVTTDTLVSGARVLAQYNKILGVNNASGAQPRIMTVGASDAGINGDRDTFIPSTTLAGNTNNNVAGNEGKFATKVALGGQDYYGAGDLLAVNYGVIENVGLSKLRSENNNITRGVNALNDANTVYGALAGINYGTISGSQLAINNPNISYQKSGRNLVVGGVVGLNFGTVTGCGMSGIATGQFNMNVASANSSVLGGIVGVNDGGTVSDSVVDFVGNMRISGTMGIEKFYLGGVLGVGAISGGGTVNYNGYPLRVGTFCNAFGRIDGGSAPQSERFTVANGQGGAGLISGLIVSDWTGGAFKLNNMVWSDDGKNNETNSSTTVMDKNVAIATSNALLHSVFGHANSKIVDTSKVNGVRFEVLDNAMDNSVQLPREIAHVSWKWNNNNLVGALGLAGYIADSTKISNLNQYTYTYGDNDTDSRVTAPISGNLVSLDNNYLQSMPTRTGVDKRFVVKLDYDVSIDAVLPLMKFVSGEGGSEATGGRRYPGAKNATLTANVVIDSTLSQSFSNSVLMKKGKSLNGAGHQISLSARAGDLTNTAALKTKYARYGVDAETFDRNVFAGFISICAGNLSNINFVVTADLGFGISPDKQAILAGIIGINKGALDNISVKYEASLTLTPNASNTTLPHILSGIVGINDGGSFNKIKLLGNKMNGATELKFTNDGGSASYPGYIGGIVGIANFTDQSKFVVNTLDAVGAVGKLYHSIGRTTNFSNIYYGFMGSLVGANSHIGVITASSMYYDSVAPITTPLNNISYQLNNKWQSADGSVGAPLFAIAGNKNAPNVISAYGSLSVMDSVVPPNATFVPANLPKPKALAIALRSSVGNKKIIEGFAYDLVFNSDNTNTICVNDPLVLLMHFTSLLNGSPTTIGDTGTVAADKFVVPTATADTAPTSANNQGSLLLMDTDITVNIATKDILHSFLLGVDSASKLMQVAKTGRVTSDITINDWALYYSKDVGGTAVGAALGLEVGRILTSNDYKRIILDYTNKTFNTQPYAIDSNNALNSPAVNAVNAKYAGYDVGSEFLGYNYGTIDKLIFERKGSALDSFSSSGNNYILGGLVGINHGAIRNVSLQNNNANDISNLDGSNGKTAASKGIVGFVSGVNCGEITNTEVVSTGSLSMSTYTADFVAFGGIAGVNDGGYINTVKLVSDKPLILKMPNVAISPTINAYVGGIIGVGSNDGLVDFAGIALATAGAVSILNNAFVAVVGGIGITAKGSLSARGNRGYFAGKIAKSVNMSGTNKALSGLVFIEIDVSANVATCTDKIYSSNSNGVATPDTMELTAIGYVESGSDGATESIFHGGRYDIIDYFGYSVFLNGYFIRRDLGAEYSNIAANYLLNGSIDFDIRRVIVGENGTFYKGFVATPNVSQTGIAGQGNQWIKIASGANTVAANIGATGGYSNLAEAKCTGNAINKITYKYEWNIASSNAQDIKKYLTYEYDKSDTVNGITTADYSIAHAKNLRIDANTTVELPLSTSRDLAEGRTVEGFNPNIVLTVTVTDTTKGIGIDGDCLTFTDGKRNIYAVGGLWSTLNGTLNNLVVNITIAGLNLTNTSGTDLTNIAFGGLAGIVGATGNIGGSVGDVKVTSKIVGNIVGAGASKSIAVGALVGHNAGTIRMREINSDMRLKGSGVAMNIFVGGVVGANATYNAGVGQLLGTATDGLSVKIADTTNVIMDMTYAGVTSGDGSAGSTENATGAISAVVGANLGGTISGVNVYDGVGNKEGTANQTANSTILWQLTGAQPGAVASGGGVAGISTGGTIDKVAYNGSSKYRINSDMGLGYTPARSHTSWAYYGGILGLGSNVGAMSVFNNGTTYDVSYGANYDLMRTAMNNIYCGNYTKLAISMGANVGNIAGRFVNGQDATNARNLIWLDFKSRASSFYTIVTSGIDVNVEERVSYDDYWAVLGAVSSSLNSELNRQNCNKSGTGVASGTKVWVTNVEASRVYLSMFRIWFSNVGNAMPSLNIQLYGFMENNGYTPYVAGKNISELGLAVIDPDFATAKATYPQITSNVLSPIAITPTIADIVGGNGAEVHNIFRIMISGNEFIITNSDQLHDFISNGPMSKDRQVGILMNDINLTQAANNFKFDKTLSGAGKTVTLTPTGNDGVNAHGEKVFTTPSDDSAVEYGSLYALPDTTPLKDARAFFRGMFVGGILSNGVIKNVNFVYADKVSIETNTGRTESSVGGIICAVNAGEINNCTLTLQDGATFMSVKNQKENKSATKAAQYNMAITGGFAGMMVNSSKSTTMTNCTFNMSPTSFIRSLCYAWKAEYIHPTSASIRAIPHMQSICGGMAGWMGENSSIINATLNGAGIIEATSIIQMYFTGAVGGHADRASIATGSQENLRSNIYKSSAGAVVGLSSTNRHYAGGDDSINGGLQYSIYTNVDVNISHQGYINGVINNWYGFTLEYLARKNDLEILAVVHDADYVEDKVDSIVSYRQIAGTFDTIPRGNNVGKYASMLNNVYIVAYSETGMHPNPPESYSKECPRLRANYPYNLRYIGRCDEILTVNGQPQRPEAPTPFKVYLYDNTPKDFDPSTAQEAKANSSISLSWDKSTPNPQNAKILFNYDIYADTTISKSNFLWSIEGYKGGIPPALHKEGDLEFSDNTGFYNPVYTKIASLHEALGFGVVHQTIDRGSNWYLYYAIGSVGSASVDKTNYYYTQKDEAYYHKEVIPYGSGFTLPKLKFYNLDGSALEGAAVDGAYKNIKIFKFENEYNKNETPNAATTVQLVEGKDYTNNKGVITFGTPPPSAGSYFVKFDFTGGKVEGGTGSMIKDIPNKTIVFPEGDMAESNFTLIEVIIPIDISAGQMAIVKTYNGKTDAGDSRMDIDKTALAGAGAGAVAPGVPNGILFDTSEVVYTVANNIATYNTVSFKVMPWQYYSYNKDIDGLGYNHVYLFSAPDGTGSSFVLEYNLKVPLGTFDENGIRIVQTGSGASLAFTATVRGRGVIAPKQIDVKYVQKDFDNNNIIDIANDSLAMSPAVMEVGAVGVGNGLVNAPRRFDNATVGNDKNVIFAGMPFAYNNNGNQNINLNIYMQCGAGLSNYAFKQNTAIRSLGVSASDNMNEISIPKVGTIMPLALTVEYIYKTYDGTTTVTYGSSNSTIKWNTSSTLKPSNFSPTAEYGSANVVYNGSGQYNSLKFNVKSIIDKRDNSNKYCFTNAGANLNYYIANNGVTIAGDIATLPNLGVIVPEEITLKKAVKIYDGTTTLLYSGNGAGISFEKGGSAFSIGYTPSGSFADADSNATININFGSKRQFVFAPQNDLYFLDNGVKNFAIKLSSLTGKGAITPKQANVSKVKKEFDGRDSIAGNTVTMTGTISASTLTPNFKYSTIDAGDGKGVVIPTTVRAINGIGYLCYSANTNYYIVTGQSTNQYIANVGVITPKAVTVSVRAKEYDGTTAVTPSDITINNYVSGSSNLSGHLSGVYNSKDAGSRTVNIDVNTVNIDGTSYKCLKDNSVSSGINYAGNYYVNNSATNSTINQKVLNKGDFRIISFSNKYTSGASGIAFEYRTSASYSASGSAKLMASDTITVVFVIVNNNGTVMNGAVATGSYYARVSSISGNNNYTLNGGNATSANIATVYNGGSAATFAVIKQTISTANMWAIMNNSAREYTGSALTFGDVVIKMTDIDNNELSASATYSKNLIGNNGATSPNVGNYDTEITVTAISDSNYTISGNSVLQPKLTKGGTRAKFAIYPKNVSVSGASKVYDGNKTVPSSTNFGMGGMTPVSVLSQSDVSNNVNIIYLAAPFVYIADGGTAETTKYRFAYVASTNPDGTKVFALSNFTILTNGSVGTGFGMFTPTDLPTDLSGYNSYVVTNSAQILPKQVTITVEGVTKVYDGNTSLKGNITATGTINDAVIKVGGQFSTHNAGTNIPLALNAETTVIMVDGIECYRLSQVEGDTSTGDARASNYCIAKTDANAMSGTITKRIITANEIDIKLFGADGIAEILQNVEYGNNRTYTIGGAPLLGGFGGTISVGDVGVDATANGIFPTNLWRAMLYRVDDIITVTLTVKFNNLAVTELHNAGAYTITIAIGENAGGVASNYSTTDAVVLDNPVKTFTIAKQKVTTDNVTAQMNKFAYIYGDSGFKQPSPHADINNANDKRGYTLRITDKFDSTYVVEYADTDNLFKIGTMSFAFNSDKMTKYDQISSATGIYVGGYYAWLKTITGGDGNYEADTVNVGAQQQIKCRDGVDEIVYYILPRPLDINAVTKTYDGTTTANGVATTEFGAKYYAEGVTPLTFDMRYSSKNSTHTSAGVALIKHNNVGRIVDFKYTDTTYFNPTATVPGNETYHMATLVGGSASNYCIDTATLTADGYASMLDKAVIKKFMITSGSLTIDISGYVVGADKTLKTFTVTPGANTLLEFVYAYQHVYDKTNVKIKTFTDGILKAGDTIADLNLVIGNADEADPRFENISNAHNYIANISNLDSENYEMTKRDLCRINISKQEITDAQIQLQVPYYNVIYGNPNMGDPSQTAGFFFNARDGYNGKIFLSSQIIEGTEGAVAATFEYVDSQGAVIVPNKVGRYLVRATVNPNFVENENYIYRNKDGQVTTDKLVFVANGGQPVYFILPKEVKVESVVKDYDGNTSLGIVTKNEADLLNGDTLNLTGHYFDKNVKYTVDAVTGAINGVNYNDVMFDAQSFQYYYTEEGAPTVAISATAYYIYGTNYTVNGVGVGSSIKVAGVGVIKPRAINVGAITKMYDGTNIVKYEYGKEATPGNISTESGFSNFATGDTTLHAKGIYGGVNKGTWNIVLECATFVYGAQTWRTLVGEGKDANAGNYYVGGSGSTITYQQKGIITQLDIGGASTEGKLSDFMFRGFLYDGSTVANNNDFYNNGFFYSGHTYTLADLVAKLTFSGGGVVRTITGGAGSTFSVQGIVSSDILTFSFKFIKGAQEVDGVTDNGVYQFVFRLTNANENYIFNNGNDFVVSSFVINKQTLDATNISVKIGDVGREYNANYDDSDLTTILQNAINGYNVIDKQGKVLSLAPTNKTLLGYAFADGIRPINAGRYALNLQIGAYDAGDSNYKWEAGIAVSACSIDGNKQPFVIRPKNILITTEDLTKTKNFDGTIYYYYTPIVGSNERVVVGDYAVDMAMARVGKNVFEMSPTVLFVELMGVPTNDTLLDKVNVVDRTANYQITLQNPTNGKLTANLTIEDSDNLTVERAPAQNAGNFGFNINFAISGLRGLQFMVGQGGIASELYKNFDDLKGYDTSAYTVSPNYVASILPWSVNEKLNFILENADRYTGLKLNTYIGGDGERYYTLSGIYTANGTSGAGNGMDVTSYSDRYSVYIKGSKGAQGSNISTTSSALAEGQYQGVVVGSQLQRQLKTDGIAISNADELKAFINGGSGTAHLVNSIYNFDNTGVAGVAFNGALYGNGYTIQLLGGLNAGATYSGYFVSELGASAIIDSVNFKFMSHTSASGNYVGLVAGKNSGTITNCSLDIIKSPVSTATNNGGFAGLSVGTMTNVGVVYDNNVTLTAWGGIASEAQNATFNRISARGQAIAGNALIGTASGTTTINGIVDMVGGTLLGGTATTSNVYTVNKASTLSGIMASEKLVMIEPFTTGYIDYYFTNECKSNLWSDNKYSGGKDENNKSMYYVNAPSGAEAVLVIEVIAPKDRFIWEAVAHSYQSPSGIADGHINISLNRYVAVFAIGTTLTNNSFTTSGVTTTLTFVTSGVNMFNAAVGIRGTTVTMVGEDVKEVEYNGREQTHTITATVDGTETTVTISGTEAGYYDGMIAEVSGGITVDNISYDINNRAARVVASASGSANVGAILIIYPKKTQLDNTNSVDKTFDTTSIAEKKLTIDSKEYLLVGEYYNATGTAETSVVGATNVSFANSFNSIRKALVDTSGNLIYIKTNVDSLGVKTYEYSPIKIKKNGVEAPFNKATQLVDDTGALLFEVGDYMRAIMKVTDYDEACAKDKALATNVNYTWAYIYDVTATLDNTAGKISFTPTFYGVSRLRNTVGVTGASNYMILDPTSVVGTDIFAGATTKLYIGNDANAQAIVNARTRLGAVGVAGHINPIGLTASYSLNLEQSYRAEIVSPNITSGAFETIVLPTTMTAQQIADFETYKTNFGTVGNVDVLHFVASGLTYDELSGKYSATNNTSYNEVALPTNIDFKNLAGAADNIKNATYKFEPTAIKLRYFLRSADGKNIIASGKDFLMIGNTEGDYNTLQYVLTDNVNCKSAIISPFDWKEGSTTRSFSGSITSAGTSTYEISNFIIIGDKSEVALFATMASGSSISNVIFGNVIVDSKNTTGDVNIGILNGGAGVTLTNITTEGMAVSNTSGVVTLKGHGGIDFVSHVNNNLHTTKQYLNGVEIVGYLTSAQLQVGELYKIINQFVFNNTSLKFRESVITSVQTVAVSNFRNWWAWSNICPWLQPFGNIENILKPTPQLQYAQ